MILLITNRGDYHSDLLIRSAYSYDAPITRLNFDQGSSQIGVSMTNQHVRLEYLDRELDLSTVKLLIVRRPHLPHQAPSDWPERIVNAEWQELISFVSDACICPQVNSLPASIFARNKYAQLNRARSFGLRTPPFVVSRDQAELRGFAYGRRCITKAMSRGYARTEEKQITSYTWEVRDSDIQDSALACPIILQELIEPKYMWRMIFTFGEFSCIRLSGEELLHETDSRLIEDQLDGELANPPAYFVRQMHSFVDSFGINYCSSDVIEAADGTLYFLDLNPDGQFGFYQDLVGVSISDKIIKKGLQQIQ